MFLTNTRRIAYRFFARTVLLLMLYAALTLLGAVKFLGSDSLALSFPYHQVGAFANVLLNLTILTGLLGGGIYVVASSRPDSALVDERLLSYLDRLWSLFLLLAFFAGALGLLEGRHLLELPPLLDVMQVILIVLFLITVTRSVTDWTSIVLVWTLGMALTALCTVIGLIPAGDYFQDRVLRALAVNLNLNVAYLLAALALAFWLMHRFSNVMPGWADMGLYTTGGLMALAGVLVSIAPLHALGAGDLTRTFGNIAVFVAPLACLILAAHSYRALSDRNPSRTLSAHWVAFGVLLILLGIGVLGALGSASEIIQWTLGTRLTDLQATLTAFATVAIVLGVINQATAELRGENRRITGLMPFWFVSFGVVGGGVALAGAGLVQVYLERILGIGYLETQTLIIPLYLLWIVGTLSMAVGVGIYALGFRARQVVVPE